MFEKWFSHYHAETTGRKLKVFATGFVVYEIASPPQFFISDFYIAPEFRQSGKAFEYMLEWCKEEAMTRGALKFTARLNLFNQNASAVLISYLKYGFKIIETNGGQLGISKDVI